MNKDSLQCYLPNPVEITDEIIADSAGRDQLLDLVIQLYREAGSICALCASAYVGDNSSEEPMKRNQAICAGLLVRTTKFMTAVNYLATGTERGEVIMALNRSITESVINLMFLIANSDEELYDRYVAASLGTEREFYDLVKRNIERRGETLRIEETILKSIRRVAQLSDADIEQVNQRFTDWDGGLRQRYAALGQADRYVTEARMGSHAIHGTWVDLVHHHLRAVGDGFVTEWVWSDSDGQLLAPVAIFVLDAAQGYLTKFFKDVGNYELLVDRIENLQERVLKVESTREDWSLVDRSD